MMTYQVLKITAQKTNSGRVNLHFPGFVLGFSRQLILENKLSVGDFLTSGQLKKLISTDLIKRGINKSLKFIAARPRSEKEIERKTADYLFKIIKKIETQKRFNLVSEVEKATEAVLYYLRDKNLVDDEAFAVWWIEQRLEFRPRSKRELYSELLSRGLERKLIEKKLAETSYNEEAVARFLIDKKIKTLPGDLSKTEKRNKLLDYLSRKGFSFSQIIDLIDERLGKR